MLSTLWRKLARPIVSSTITSPVRISTSNLIPEIYDDLGKSFAVFAKNEEKLEGIIGKAIEGKNSPDILAGSSAFIIKMMPEIVPKASLPEVQPVLKLYFQTLVDNMSKIPIHHSIPVFMLYQKMDLLMETNEAISILSKLPRSMKGYENNNLAFIINSPPDSLVKFLYFAHSYEELNDTYMSLMQYFKQNGASTISFSTNRLLLRYNYSRLVSSSDIYENHPCIEESHLMELIKNVQVLSSLEKLYLLACIQYAVKWDIVEEEYFTEFVKKLQFNFIEYDTSQLCEIYKLCKFMGYKQDNADLVKQINESLLKFEGNHTKLINSLTYVFTIDPKIMEQYIEKVLSNNETLRILVEKNKLLYLTKIYETYKLKENPKLLESIQHVYYSLPNLDYFMNALQFMSKISGKTPADIYSEMYPKLLQANLLSNGGIIQLVYASVIFDIKKTHTLFKGMLRKINKVDESVKSAVLQINIGCQEIFKDYHDMFRIFALTMKLILDTKSYKYNEVFAGLIIANSGEKEISQCLTFLPEFMHKFNNNKSFASIKINKLHPKIEQYASMVNMSNSNLISFLLAKSQLTPLTELLSKLAQNELATKSSYHIYPKDVGRLSSIIKKYHDLVTLPSLEAALPNIINSVLGNSCFSDTQKVKLALMYHKKKMGTISPEIVFPNLLQLIGAHNPKVFLTLIKYIVKNKHEQLIYKIVKLMESKLTEKAKNNTKSNQLMTAFLMHYGIRRNCKVPMNKILELFLVNTSCNMQEKFTILCDLIPYMQNEMKFAFVYLFKQVYKSLKPETISHFLSINLCKQLEGLVDETMKSPGIKDSARLKLAINYHINIHPLVKSLCTSELEGKPTFMPMTLLLEYIADWEISEPWAINFMKSKWEYLKEMSKIIKFNKIKGKTYSISLQHLLSHPKIKKQILDELEIYPHISLSMVYLKYVLKKPISDKFMFVTNDCFYEHLLPNNSKIDYKRNDLLFLIYNHNTNKYTLPLKYFTYGAGTTIQHKSVLVYKEILTSLGIKESQMEYYEPEIDKNAYQVYCKVIDDCIKPAPIVEVKETQGEPVVSIQQQQAMAIESEQNNLII